ncbi:MAG: hypothetical protein HC884_10635 [Chloroflexaceae bacterium]|nr:hypothetical protein [Chloroflexaceae bacterium]
MEPIGGLYEPWASITNPALWFMVGMIVLPMVFGWMVAKGQLEAPIVTYEAKTGKKSTQSGKKKKK